MSKLMSFVALLIATLLSVPPDDLAAQARERSRQLARQGTWTPADVQALLKTQLVDPERFVSDEAFRARVLEALPRSLDPSAPPRLRDELLLELNQVRGIDFAASEAIERSWGAAPRSALERRVPFPVAEADRLRFFDEAEAPLAASVYSLPSFFFSPEAAEAFLAGVRRAAPDRTLIVLTDVPLRRRLEGSGLKLRLLETYGRPYSPWPRDPFSLVRSPSGAVRVLVRPNLQPGREEDASLGPELIQNLPEDLDRAWGGAAWAEAPVPFHNGQVLLTRDAAWITLHALEPHILSALKLDRVPVETFSDAKGVDRYVTAAEKAAKELETLYGRPVRFVHPLSSEDSPVLMRRIGGGAGYDLDSIVTLLPGKKALVADADAGRELLSKMKAEDWKSLRDGYGLQPSAKATAPSADLDGFLDLVADHLRKEGMEVRRLPLLAVPVALLRDREGLTHDEFLITWNNIVAETRAGHLRAEGFASLIPAGDRLARETFAAAGARLDLFPPLVRSVILNGGYRCASNHVREAPAGKASH
jgi:phage terminase Nu1 subunit (DNA packaging protein)